MSIEAMKLALEALETEQALRHGYSYRGGVRIVSTADKAINALRNAIQQAEAKQPATGEPLTETFVQKVPDHCDRVVWRGQYIHLPMTRTAIQQAETKTDELVQVFLVRDVASLLGASVPDVCDALAELGYEPRRSTNAAISPDEAIAVAKRINPAPGVSDDSKRLDYLQDRGATIDLIPGVANFYPMRFRVGGLHSSANIDVRAAIDVAMLAAKERP